MRSWIINSKESRIKYGGRHETRRLKIGHSCLEVRCEVAQHFETVMSTVAVDVGSWYYEVTIITEGLMEIGWASRQAKFLQKWGEAYMEWEMINSGSHMMAAGKSCGTKVVRKT